AQLVTGATQEMRILTGSAACAALAPRSAAAATLANSNLDKRMGIPPVDCSFAALRRFTRNVAERRRFWQAPNWRALASRGGAGGMGGAWGGAPPRSPPLGFDGKDAGDRGSDRRDDRERDKNRRQAASEHHSHHRGSDHRC